MKRTTAWGRVEEAMTDEAYASVLAGRRRLALAREIARTGHAKDGMSVEEAKELLKRSPSKGDSVQ